MNWNNQWPPYQPPQQPVQFVPYPVYEKKDRRYRRKDAAEDLMKMADTLKKVSEFFDKDKKKDEKKKEEPKEIKFEDVCRELGKTMITAHILGFMYYELWVHFLK